MNPDYARLLAASKADRRDLFIASAVRLGTTVQNVEKDVWVCWTLDALFNGLPPGGPRLLFKGGTSLSKGFNLIERFSEDIDITVFRDDLGVGASVTELGAMSGKQRGRYIDGIRASCQEFIAGPLQSQLTQLASALPNTGTPLRIAPDQSDPDGQSLLLLYPAITETGDGYVQPAVKIEAGAKSALDPHAAATITPYIAGDLKGFDLAVTGVVTVDPVRTFWDKVVSRHYYDIYRLMMGEVGSRAIADRVMASDCVNHARMFFNRPDFDLATAAIGSFALLPHDGMLDQLRRDYAAMQVMIFGEVPAFAAVMASVAQLESTVNSEEK
jgi:hypothetical protein